MLLFTDFCGDVGIRTYGFSSDRKTKVWCATMGREYVSLAQPEHHLVLSAKQNLDRLCDCSVYECVAECAEEERN